jgi:hypothetical protein
LFGHAGCAIAFATIAKRILIAIRRFVITFPRDSGIVGMAESGVNPRGDCLLRRHWRSFPHAYRFMGWSETIPYTPQKAMSSAMTIIGKFSPQDGEGDNDMREIHRSKCGMGSTVTARDMGD